MNMRPADITSPHRGSCSNTSVKNDENTTNDKVNETIPFELARSPIFVGRKPRRAKAHRKERKTWSKREDKLLEELLKKEQCKRNWSLIADTFNEDAGSDRTGKQCRERWQNHLRPDLKKGNWTVEEEESIHSYVKAFGPKWSLMAKLMQGRTDNCIKNKWNSMQRTKKTQEAKLADALAIQEEVARQKNGGNGFAQMLEGGIDHHEDSVSSLGLFNFANTQGRFFLGNTQGSVKEATETDIKQGVANHYWGPLQV